MSYQLIFHPEAEKEYLEAYQWYEQEKKGLGERFEKMVEQRLQQILLNPENYGISKTYYRETSKIFFLIQLFINPQKEEVDLYSSILSCQTKSKIQVQEVRCIV